MKSFEKNFFNLLAKELKFFMKNYYSKFHNKNKWVGLLDFDEYVISVIVTKESDEKRDFQEVKDYLSKELNKPFSLNLIVLTYEEYRDYSENEYNKVVFSLSEKKILYCSENSKAFIPILDYITNTQNNKKIGFNFKKYKITYTIIAINTLIYILEVIKSRNLLNIDIYTLVNMGAKVNILINNGEFYRLITSTFLHGGIIHIFFNMSALKIMGKEVELIYGGKRYLLIYFLSALGGSITSYFSSSNGVSVGASGAIFGLLGAMLIFGFNEREKIGKRYVKGIFETIILNVIIGITIPNIDIFAHLGGLLVGVVTTFLLSRRKNPN